MNRTLQFLSVTAIAMALLVAACRKTPGPQKNDPFVPVEPTPPTNPTQTTPTLASFYSDLKPVPQSITVPAGVAQTVYAAKGTMLNFYPNSFKDASGNVITSGNVTVKITEMYKPGAMISNKASTVAAEGILESGGQIYIEASKGGQPVYPRKYGIGFSQSSADSSSMTKPMAIFKGNTTSNADGITTWTIADTSKQGTIAKITTWSGPGTPASGASTTFTGSGGSVGTPSNRFLFDSCTDFGWINCDRFWDSTGARTDIKITTAEAGFDYNNTAVFVILTAVNSTVRTNYNNSTKTFYIAGDYTHQVPVGMNASVIVMSKKNDLYYYYEQKGNVINNMNVTANMRQMSLDSVKIKLSNL